MVCPVCGRKSQYNRCPDCGFDSSRDYEKYPTLGPIGNAPAVSALRKEWEKKGTGTGTDWRKWLLPVMIACAAVLILCIGMTAGFDRGKSWEENILRSDKRPSLDAVHLTASYVVKAPVFGSEYRREQICSVTFLDTLQDAPEKAWDVSEAGDGRVLAWVVPNGELYDLYIGAEGGIRATEACEELFAGYCNVQQIHGMDALHTEGATSMRGMFIWCWSLTSLDVRGLDTSNVQDMSDVFYSCEALTGLDLSHFNTAQVRTMNGMFSCCEALTSLDLRSFDTANVEDMGRMFSYCELLTDLKLNSFNMSKIVEADRMFEGCPSGDAWQHLLK